MIDYKNLPTVEMTVNDFNELEDRSMCIGDDRVPGERFRANLRFFSWNLLRRGRRFARNKDDDANHDRTEPDRRTRKGDAIMRPVSRHARQAKVTIASVYVMCPRCDETVPNMDGGLEWDECVSGHSRTVCNNCGQLVNVPDVYSRFGTPLRFRSRH